MWGPPFRKAQDEASDSGGAVGVDICIVFPGVFALEMDMALKLWGGESVARKDGNLPWELVPRGGGTLCGWC